ncbi:recombination regulator RecX [Sediminibacillus massiliensis]|uniref:recombination regulator RecX n=1 Tax=Sediminibacillus massiliensis TaxID=1926277 RepID=UPI0031840643
MDLLAKITRITTQKKSKSRYNIFLDQEQGEKYGFSVDEDILIQYQLRKGLELNESDINALIQKDNLQKSFTLGLNFLSYRMRSKKEMYDYLVKKEVDPDQIPVVIDRLENEGFLNDRDFAHALIRTRINTTSKGPLLLRKELIDKGVARTIADEAVGLFPYEEQYKKAEKWVAKKLKNDGRKSFKQQVQSIQQTLLQKGFNSEIIKDVLNDIDDNRNEDAEWEAVVHQGQKILAKQRKKTEGSELRHKVKAALYRKGFSFEHIERFLDEYTQEDHGW